MKNTAEITETKTELNLLGSYTESIISRKSIAGGHCYCACCSEFYTEDKIEVYAGDENSSWFAGCQCESCNKEILPS